MIAPFEPLIVIYTLFCYQKFQQSSSNMPVELEIIILHKSILFREMNRSQTFIILSVVLCLFTSSYLLSESRNPSVSEFASWKQKFNKVYESEHEELYRLSIFSRNLLEIKAHNEMGTSTYQKGLNQFSDLTEEQFVAQYLNEFKTPIQSFLRVQMEEEGSEQNSADVDWRAKGYVTSVKNEGQCGACWAFSAIGSLEAVNKQKGNQLISLSAQQLLDCSLDYGNYGCNGGLMTNAFKYIKEKGGIATEDSYPYKGVHQDCKFDGGPVKITGFTEIKDCNTLANELVNRPIAVGVDATKFYFYKSGVFDGCSASLHLNHANTIVGMTEDYWLCKELWGTSFGEDGYIRISKKNDCGVCQLASYPSM